MPINYMGPASTFNSAFADKLLANPGDAGMQKEAAVSIGSFIRDEVREDSFVADKIMTEQKINFSDLDRDLNLDRLRKIVELEPESIARWVSFRGLPRSRYLEQDAAEVPFAMITTDKTIKNLFELKTRQNDVRKIISDNNIKDVLAQQDGKWIELVDDAADAFGYKDTYSGGFTKNNVAEALKPLEARKIPIGCMLINSTTAKELLKWDKNDIGDTHVSDQYTKGVTITQLMGVKLIITNKNEYVPDNRAYFFGKEDFLGKFFTLQDTTVYFEQKGTFIMFYAYKVLGMLLANAKAIHVADFEV